APKRRLAGQRTRIARLRGGIRGFRWLAGAGFLSRRDLLKEAMRESAHAPKERPRIHEASRAEIRTRGRERWFELRETLTIYVTKTGLIEVRQAEMVVGQFCLLGELCVFSSRPLR